MSGVLIRRSVVLINFVVHVIFIKLEFQILKVSRLVRVNGSSCKGTCGLLHIMGQLIFAVIKD